MRQHFFGRKLGNARYQMLLMDIALSLSTGQGGFAPSTIATRRDFIAWSFQEMQACLKPLTEELRQMPLGPAAPAGTLAGLPFELPNENLPQGTAEQVAYLQGCVSESRQLRGQIQNSLNPTPKQKGILAMIENIDVAILQKLSPSASAT